MMASSHADLPQGPPMVPSSDVEAPTSKLMDPELLMAARSGDCKRLRYLLGGEERQTAQVVMDIQNGMITVSNGTNGSLVTPLQASTGATGEGADRSASSSLLEGVTFEGDTVLHVLAACRSCLECATLIYDKGKHLLHAPNRKGDTPVHLAARAGRVKMVDHLISLARAADGEDERVRTLLRKPNERGETALHEAIRSGDRSTVQVLVAEDPGFLALVSGGMSPLFLAIFLGHVEIAQLLHDASPGNLSYCGADGQHVSHLAVLRGSVITKMVLDWNKDLTKQRDKSGSTPLHFAASVDGPDNEILNSMILIWSHLRQLHGPTKILVDANKSSAYQPDNIGSFPIHVAASAGRLKAIIILLAACPDCAGLRDARGKTFLHVAVEKKRCSIVAYACRRTRFASVLNMQDNDGNTAVHLAVQVGSQQILCSLLHNQQVSLNLPNNQGLTALDLSWSSTPRGFYYPSNPRTWIQQTLIFVNALDGSCRRDYFQELYTQKKDEHKDAEKLTESAQVMGIGAVLIATVTFAAAFTLPGGYKADDHTNGGSPTFAGSYSFDAFIISNALAFICSLLATFSLMYSGVAAIEFHIRLRYLDTSVVLLHNSARSLIAAFAMGLYAVLAPVSHRTAVAVCVITFSGLLYGNMEVWQTILHANSIRVRLGIRATMIRGAITIFGVLANFWPYIVIFGLPAYLKNHKAN